MSHLNDLADDHAATIRDEIASQRAADAHLIVDARPDAAAEEPGGPEPARGWWCRHCETSHRDGDPFDGCPVCGHVIGAQQ
jgi:rubrerythrin